MKDELRQAMLRRYGPAFMFMDTSEGAPPIPGMHPAAARGIVMAFEQKLLGDRAWDSILYHWEGIWATVGV